MFFTAVFRCAACAQIYGEMLFEKYLHEEEEQRENERRRLEEGLRLIEKKKTERELLDARMIERNEVQTTVMNEAWDVDATVVEETGSDDEDAKHKSKLSPRLMSRRISSKNVLVHK